MTDTKMSSQLEMRWLPVTDATGRTRLEAHWVEVGHATPTHGTAAA